jgi:beta-lactamase regulating signal transducer with metallopeptidase domain/protocatechuate 3,4-dioxygenase beta subunit
MNALVDSGWRLLVDATLKSTVLLAAAWIVLAMWRPRNGSVAHRVWTMALVAMLAMPLLVPWAPGVSLPRGVYPPLAGSQAGRPTVSAAALPQDDAAPVEPPLAAVKASPRGAAEPPALSGGAPPSLAPGPRTTPTAAAELSTAERPASVSKFKAVALLLYLAGAAWLGARLLAGLVRTKRLVARARVLESPAANRAATIGCRILESNDVIVPVTVGMFRPAVLLPADWTTWSEPLLQSVLAHEGEHVRRRDVSVAALAALNRALYWFHPAAWRLRRRLADLAEQVCDDAVIAATGNRAGYARSLLEIAKRLSGARRRMRLVGVAMARTSQVERRIEAIVDPDRPLSGRLNAVSAWLVSGIALPAIVVVAGLRADGEAIADEPAPAPRAEQAATEAGGQPITLAGRCVDGDKPLKDVRLRVVRVDRSRSTAELVVEQQTGDDGRFQFAELPPAPAPFEGPAWHYIVLATAPGRASGVNFHVQESKTADQIKFDMPMAAAIRGRVTDAEGQPVVGAKVWTVSPLGGPLDDVMSATTDGDGRYEIGDARPWAPGKEQPRPAGRDVPSPISATSCFLHVRHPDYGGAVGAYQRVPADVDVTLQPAATIVGVVFDEVDGALAQDVVVSMQATHDSTTIGDSWQQTRTDAKGKYRLTSVSPGKYNIWAEAKDRTCVAVDSLEVTEAKQIAAPFLRLVQGGWIEGVVIDAAGNPVAKTSHGKLVQIGIYGPSRPRSGAAIQSTTVDAKGYFRIRAAPGANYPYACVDLTPFQALDVGPTEVIEGKTTPVIVRVVPKANALGGRPIGQAPPPVELPLPVDAEREAAAAIRELGGWYNLDDESHVVEVNMVYYDEDGIRRDNNQTSDEALKHVAAFPRLKGLFLKEGQASDEGLSNVRGLTNLERVFMWDAARVTDKGAAELAALPNLQYIHLSNSQITDEAIRLWQRLPKLHGLSLQGNRFTDRGLEYAAQIPNLREFFVGNGETAITDAGLAYLAELPSLERLDLQRTGVTDAGLAPLESLGRLKTLWLSGTAVTPAGLARLAAKLPDLETAHAGVGNGNGGRNLLRDAAQELISNAPPPKLAYLAWQVRDSDSEGPVIGPLWAADGGEVDAEVDAKLRQLVQHPPHNRRPEDRVLAARPLVLFFADDSPLDRRPVTALVVMEDGRRLANGSALNAHVDGFRVSALAPERPFEWPKSATIQIQCASGSPRIVKELREIPATPIDLGEGVQWVGRQNAQGQLETMLSRPRQALESRTAVFQIRLYAKGKQWPADSNGGYSTIVDDRDTSVATFDLKREDVDLVRILRQDLMSAMIDDVPLSLDLLHEAEKAGTP